MAGFSDFSYAAKFIGLMKKIAREQIEELRPKPKYAEVLSIDRPNRKCLVLYPGEVDGVWVTMGALQPYGEGVHVRIEGVPNDRYITDILGKAYLDEGP
jgi:hypothetical protein